MRSIIVCMILYFSIVNIFAQNEQKDVKTGNKLYENKKYSDAEIAYRKALEKQKNSQIANFNLGNALYRENKFDEAANQYSTLQDAQLNKKNLAKVYYNQGNAFLQSKKIKESIEAYEKSLKNYPQDYQAKYNLAYAQNLLEQQKNQQNQNNQNNQDQNKQNQKDKQQNKQDKNQQNKQDQNQNKQNQNQQQQQPQSNKLSKEDAKRMLEALQNDENNLQEKLKKEQAVSKKVHPAIDW